MHDEKNARCKMKLRNKSNKKVHSEDLCVRINLLQKINTERGNRYGLPQSYHRSRKIAKYIFFMVYTLPFTFLYSLINTFAVSKSILSWIAILLINAMYGSLSVSSLILIF